MINTIIICPKCKTQMDIKDIKKQIKLQILTDFDLELDKVLEKI